MADFIPTNEGDFVKWTQNMDSKIDTVGKDLGVDAAGAAEIKAANKSARDSIAEDNAAKIAAETAKKNKENNVSKAIAVNRKYAKQMKAHSNYTDAKGKDLQVVTKGFVFDPATYKPKIKAKVMPGRVIIEFVKSKLSGVYIYTRQKGEVIWTILTYDTFSPYEDNRPLADPTKPEHREYMAIGAIKDKEATLQSDIIEVVFGG